MQDVYPSKLLLFGEYLAIAGADILAVPFWQLSAHFSDAHLMETIDPIFQSAYLRLAEHIKKHPVLSDIYDLKAFEDGFQLFTDIPIGYGLGSSGALVAAVYDHFAVKKTTDVNTLKEILAETENCFHGSSSGIDPLLSYLVLPIARKNGQLEKISLAENVVLPYLVDSGISRNTEKLVGIFKEKMQDKSFAKRIEEEMIPLNTQMIKAFLGIDSFENQLAAYSKLQFELLKEMIPEEVAHIWQYGLDSNHFHFKLCGAGGGGYFMAWVRDIAQFKSACGALTYFKLNYAHIHPPKQ